LTKNGDDVIQHKWLFKRLCKEIADRATLSFRKIYEYWRLSY